MYALSAKVTVKFTVDHGIELLVTTPHDVMIDSIRMQERMISRKEGGLEYDMAASRFLLTVVA
jgi:hypothetical protein